MKGGIRHQQVKQNGKINNPTFQQIMRNVNSHSQFSTKTADVIEAYSKKYRYPCTGRTKIEGFPDFLRDNLGPSRNNLKRLKQFPLE